MKTFTALALGACMTVAIAGAGFAQSSSMSKMSDSDKAMMTKCKGMSESAMKADKNCMAMMKAHPEMMNNDPSSKNKTMQKNTK